MTPKTQRLTALTNVLSPVPGVVDLGRSKIANVNTEEVEP